MDLLGLLIALCIILLIVAVVVGRVDWFRALVAIVALIALWALLGGTDLTLHHGP